MTLNIKKILSVVLVFAIVLASAAGISAAEPESVKWTVVDLSHWNNKVDWSLLSSAVDGVILKIGYRGSQFHSTLKEDELFYKYYQEAVKHSVHVGCYFYTYAYSVNDAVEEAKWVENKLKAYNCKLDMPIYFDFEAIELQTLLNNRQRTDIAKAFCQTLRDDGFYSGLYANKYWSTSLLYMSELSDYTLWLAQYNSTCTYTGKHDMWQYTDSGSVSGVTGKVDISKCYKNFPKYIKENGYNLFSGGTVTPPEPVTTAYNSDCGTYKTQSVTSVYSGADEGFGTKGSLPSSAEVYVYETGSSWGKISFGNDSGWIKLNSGVKKTSDYISSAASAGFYEVNTQNLNIRTGPSTVYAKDGQVHLGEKVFIFKVSSGWGSFYYSSGKTGWISLDYADFTGTVSFNGGSAKGTMAPMQIKTGQSAKLSKCSFTSADKFEGWATKSGGAVVYKDGASITMAKSNIVLYAVYSKPVTASVTFKTGADVDNSLKVITVRDKKITAAQFKEKYVSLSGGATAEISNLKSDRVVTGSVLTANAGGIKTVYTIAVTGDINSDGRCDHIDLCEVLTYTQGAKDKSDFTAAQLSAMDVNRDTKIDAKDIEAIKNAAYALAAL